MKFAICSQDRGTAFELTAPISCSLLRDAEAPATQLTAQFPWSENLPEMPWLCISDHGTEVFAGPIDQVQESLGTSAVCTITARSPAALLLDSEALPGTYQDPDLGTLFRAHAAPYGFTSITGDTRSFSGTYTVAKGASEWTALDGFCKTFLGVPLREEGGQLLAVPQTFGVPLVIGHGGLACQQFCRTRSPYRLLSSVWKKGEDGWVEAATDLNAAKQGIVRRRLCKDPDAALETAHKNAASVTILLAGRVLAQPNAPVVLRQEGRSQNMVVTAVRWSLSEQGETTRLSLRPVSER